MTDVISEELIFPPFTAEPSDEFKKSLLNMKKSSVADLEQNSKSRIDNLLDKVYEWERTFGDKVGENEIEALESLSLVLATVKIIAENKGLDINQNKYAYEQGIETQRDVLKLVFRNLDENKMPNKVVARSLGLICCVFEDYLSDSSVNGEESKYVRSSGLWQGTLGMITAAQMFYRSGFRVFLPPVRADMEDDIDLVVKGNMNTYAVDVTASMYPKGFSDESHGSGLFLIHKFTKEEKPFLAEKYSQLTGFIKINIPPFWHYEADAFYEPGYKAVGCPRQSSVDDLIKVLKS